MKNKANEINRNSKQMDEGFKQTDIGLIPVDWDINLKPLKRFFPGFKISLTPALMPVLIKKEQHYNHFNGLGIK